MARLPVGASSLGRQLSYLEPRTHRSSVCRTCHELQDHLGKGSLYTGIGWEDLPQELGFGSGMTCWRRLERWTKADVFDQVHQLLLAKLNAANRIDWSRAAVDGSQIDANGCRHRPMAGQPR